MSDVPARRGRPPRVPLTPEVTDQFAAAIRAGDFFEVACARTGIPRNTAESWLKQGSAMTALAPTPETEAFYDAVMRAAGEVEHEAMLHIRAGNNVKGELAFLRQRFPARWGERKIDDRHEREVGAKIVGLVEAMVNDPEADLTEAQREALLEIAEGKLLELSGGSGADGH